MVTGILSSLQDSKLRVFPEPRACARGYILPPLRGSVTFRLCAELKKGILRFSHPKYFTALPEGAALLRWTTKGRPFRASNSSLIGTQGDAPVGRLPWADIWLPLWGEGNLATPEQPRHKLSGEHGDLRKTTGHAAIQVSQNVGNDKARARGCSLRSLRD